MVWILNVALDPSGCATRDVSWVPYYSFVSLRSFEVPDKPGTRGLHGHCPGFTGGAGYRPPSPGSPQPLPPDFQGVLEALGPGPESYGSLLRACGGASVRLESFVLESSLRIGEVLGPTSSSVPTSHCKGEDVAQDRLE